MPSKLKNDSKKFLLPAGPSVTRIERKIVENMMRFGWDNYEYVEKFEKEFADYHNRKYCLMTPSCTLAIHLALKTLKIKKNDEVIVPDVTWTASVSPIVETGAKPIFVDIDEENWCIDIKKLEKKINKKTKAIICVNLFGNMTDMFKIKKICKKKKIFFLEDSAESLGSEYKGIKAGKFGDISFHSFHRTKTITSGEGGAFLTDSKKIFNTAKHLRDLGRSKKNSYIAETASLKYMPSNLQGSMAYGQLKRLKELLNMKRNIFKSYKKYLLPNIVASFNFENKNCKNGLWATTIVFDKKYKININKLIKFLASKKIFAREFFRPLSNQKAYQKFSESKISKINTTSYNLFKRALVLPSHYNLTEGDIKRTSKEIIKFLK